MNAVQQQTVHRTGSNVRMPHPTVKLAATHGLPNDMLRGVLHHATCICARLLGSCVPLK